MGLRRSANRTCLGIATLELSVIMVVLLALFLGGMGVTDYLNRIRFAHQLIEQALGDSSVRPLRFDSAGTQIQVDQQAVDAYLDESMSKVAAALSAQGLGGTRVFYEIVVCPISIDETSGFSQGIQSGACRRRNFGSLSVSSALLQQTDLEQRLVAEALQSVPGANGQPSTVSLLAQPSGLYGWHSQAYLPISVGAGIRVFVSLGGTLAGAAYAQLAGEPLVYATRVIHLRGMVQ
ncbi:MAG: hypothetical protein K1X79_07515 [Oligoflexia bacterium]|nr:hypothetical protein [Oligoflexia bacterium]